MDSIPTPPPLEQLPRMIPSDQEMVEELSLPTHLTMEERWNSLNHPGKPDFVATKIATQGLELQFLPNMAHPPLFPWKKSKVPKSLQSFPKEIEALSPIVNNWIVEDIVTINYAEIPSEVHVSRLFGVPKDEIDVRPIIDLSFLNKFIKTPRFKMEHLDRTLRLLQHPAWAGIVDVQDAFLSVWIAPVFRKYFCFFLNGIMHMFKRMPFGLTTAPWIFSRLMRIIKKFLRRKGVNVNSFIDDFIIWSRSQVVAARHLRWTKEVLVWLGLKVNIKKSFTTPKQQLKYLGVELDLQTLTMSLPSKKVEKILSLCNSTAQLQYVTRHDLEGLVGLITFFHSVVPLGRMYANPIIMWMNAHTSVSSRSARVSVDSSLRKLLSPFSDRKFLESKVCFKRLIPDLVLMTDASDYGWSGVILPYCVRDSWSDLEIDYSINIKEMLAILLSIMFLKESLTGKHVVIHSDSLVVFFCIKRMGSLYCPILNQLVREFLSLCLRECITFEVRHIPGIQNVLADAGSRPGQINAMNNMLDLKTLKYCFYVLGCIPEVDCFASRENTRCKQFISPCPDYGPNCVGINALKVDWNRFRSIYAFPPPSLLEKLMPKIEDYRGKGILIAPFINNPMLSPLIKRAIWAEPLPKDYFLYQEVEGEVVLRQKFHDLWLWIL